MVAHATDERTRNYKQRPDARRQTSDTQKQIAQRTEVKSTTLTHAHLCSRGATATAASATTSASVSYTHLRAHETSAHL
eukprot:10882777-Alexandrium_andersonii.AAC.1